MTARGDDDPNEPSDPVLDSMRSVWLSMRDEDPPSVGLTELLAAARTKAEAMQPKPSWWRRALVAMKRPPALAFATTVVLVGGALIVAGQKDKLDSAPAPIEERVREMAPGGRAGAPATETVVPEPAPVATPREVDKEADRGPAGQVTSTPAPRPRPPVRRAPEKDALAEPPRTIEPETPPAASTTAPSAGKGDDRGLVIAQDPEPAPPPPAEASHEAKLKRSAPQLDTDEQIEVTGRSSAPRGPTVEQLARQSATAAARGDCPAVRAITSRILKLDKAFYRDHIASNASVKSCLK